MVSAKYLCVLGMLSVLTWGCCCGPDLVSEDEIRGKDIHPYVGLIRNFSAMNVSIPSHDSSATLILPAQGQMEYTVWQPKFKIFGYVNGKEVYCRDVKIEPKKYSYFCKNYDFLVEICPEIVMPAMVPQTCPPPPEPPCLPEPEPAPKTKPKQR